MGAAPRPHRLTELQFALTEVQQRQAMEILFPAADDGLPEHGFLAFIAAGRGGRRRTLHLRSIVPPQPGDLTWDEGLRFEPRYFARALDQSANRPGEGMVIVHCHPLGTPDPNDPPRPSKPDLHHERELLCHLARALPKGVPLAAGIVSTTGGWRIREYSFPRPKTAAEAQSRAFGPSSGTFVDGNATRIVGARQLTILRPELPRIGALAAVDSTVRLWGEAGQRRLAVLRVGIAGGGGVGSMLVEQLARLGVGEIVLIDYDILKRENLNRSNGAAAKDVGKPKISYLVRQAKQAATADKFSIGAYQASVFEEEGVRPLLDCDVILAAADDAAARQVLDHAAYAHNIPVIDGGTALFVMGDGKIIGKSQVAEAGPGRPCLRCSRVYTAEDVTKALEEERHRGADAYLFIEGNAIPEGAGKQPRAPSVISSNGLVASLMIQRLLRNVLNFPPYEGDGTQRFYIEAGQLQWTSIRECESDCEKSGLIGKGDTHLLPTGVDTNWKRA